MQTRTITRIVLSGMALAFVTLACEQPNTKNPNTPSQLPINSLEIVGPASIAPGQPVQLSANARLSDGTVKNTALLTGVNWRSNNTAVVQVSSSGVATPIASQGDAIITVDVRIGTLNRSASREVIVQPAGTFRLSGTVTEDGAPSFLVPDARVEVASGSQFAITNGLGQFKLYGVPPAADIRISANEYETRTFPVQLSDNTSRNFALPLIGTRPSLAGNYTVFIDANACTSSTPLPAELRHRAYDAVMSQTGSALDVRLIGGQFRTNSLNKGDHFTGSVVAGGARFSFDWYDSYYYPFYGPTYYPSVAERLPDGRYLVTTGTVFVTGTPGTGFSGAFSNDAVFPTMYLWDANFPAGSSQWLGGCWGAQTLRLVPR